MTIQEVHQGRLRTPFYSRLAALDTVNTWHEWKGYSSADELYCAETEYFAIRNATAVFDLTPMTKYRITGPDAILRTSPLAMMPHAPSMLAWAMLPRMSHGARRASNETDSPKRSTSASVLASKRPPQGFFAI